MKLLLPCSGRWNLSDKNYFESSSQLHIQQPLSYKVTKYITGQNYSFIKILDTSMNFKSNYKFVNSLNLMQKWVIFSKTRVGFSRLGGDLIHGETIHFTKVVWIWKMTKKSQLHHFLTCCRAHSKCYTLCVLGGR